jgi:hypothetical protein
VQQAAAQIPWFHNCMILDKAQDAAQRKWGIGASGCWKKCARRLETFILQYLILNIMGKDHRSNYPVFGFCGIDRLIMEFYLLPALRKNVCNWQRLRIGSLGKGC